MAFPFHALPPELKRTIWELVLPEIQSEVCFVWGSRPTPPRTATPTTKDAGLDDAQAVAASPPPLPAAPAAEPEPEGPPLPLLVDTAVPRLMHVCREWRAYVFAAAEAGGTFPFRFRTSRRAGCRVPCRAFIPELDVLHLGSRNIKRAVLARPKLRRGELVGDRSEGGRRYDGSGEWECGIGMATLARVRHIAIDSISMKSMRRWVPRLIFGGCPDLARVSIVYTFARTGPEGYFTAQRDARPPARRCILRRLGASRDGGSVWLPWAGHEDEVAVGHRRTYIHCVGKMGVRYIGTKRMTRRMWDTEVGLRNGETSWYTGSAWDKEESRLRVEYTAATLYDFRRSEDGQELWECGPDSEPAY